MLVKSSVLNTMQILGFMFLRRWTCLIWDSKVGEALEARSKAELLYSGKVSVIFPNSLFLKPHTKKSPQGNHYSRGVSSILRRDVRLANKDVLVVGVESDILFPVWQQREIADVLMEKQCFR